MKKYEYEIFEGERALFCAKDLDISYCTFQDGESPLKESENINLYETSFKWKYPFWYGEKINVNSCYFLEMARAGIWYSKKLTVKDTCFEAPKCFRYCKEFTIENVSFHDAKETLWFSKEFSLRNVKATGDNFALRSKDITVDNLVLVGNYCFDGCENVVVRNSRLLSKDAFWNCKNVLVEDSYIVGEYLAWNTENITFRNCTIESLQGMCYVDGLRMENCRLLNTTLSFEYSKDIDANITTVIDSVKNPSSGIIRAKGIKSLIMENDKVDVLKTKIITEV